MKIVTRNFYILKIVRIFKFGKRFYYERDYCRVGNQSNSLLFIADGLDKVERNFLIDNITIGLHGVIK